MKEIQKNFKTKHQDKFLKYKKPKPSEYNDLHKNCSKKSQY